MSNHLGHSMSNPICKSGANALAPAPFYTPCKTPVVAELFRLVFKPAFRLGDFHHRKQSPMVLVRHRAFSFNPEVCCCDRPRKS